MPTLNHKKAQKKQKWFLHLSYFLCLFVAITVVPGASQVPTAASNRCASAATAGTADALAAKFDDHPFIFDADTIQRPRPMVSRTSERLPTAPALMTLTEHNRPVCAFSSPLK